MAPDVLVAKVNPDGCLIEAADVALVAEVAAPALGHIELHYKPRLFAEAGIENYLCVQHQPEIQLILHRHEQRHTGEPARASPGECLDLPGLGCSIEVNALVGRG